MGEESHLTKSLTLFDLILFGVASTMGSGGFNLIGKATQEAGSWWPVPFFISVVLLLGASRSYSKTFEVFQNNTAESDMIREVLGPVGEKVGTFSILLFNIVSISTILVFCSQLLFPGKDWGFQIGTALLILLGMALVSLQGIDMNKSLINGVSTILLVLLTGAAALGGVGVATQPFPDLAKKKSPPKDFFTSTLYFFFILAGFDALMKFSEETKDKKHIPHSFYISNLLSAGLTFGIALAILTWLPNIKESQESNALGYLLERFLGTGTAEWVKYSSIVFMVVTTFVVYLSMTRYLYSLGEQKDSAISFFTQLNENNSPYWAVLCIFVFAAIAILINNVDRLIKLSDMGIILTILAVTVSVTLYSLKKGDITESMIHGITSLGFVGLFGITFF